MTFLEASNWELYSKTNQYEKYIRNPSDTEKETGKYFPRLTSFRQRFFQDANVRIEFSAPKLIFLNNLDELEDKDFPMVVKTLQERLETMGIIIQRTTLEDAPVCSVHFSKNIQLEGGYTASYLISEINKVNLSKSFDFAKTRFVNDGQSLYAHNDSHQFVIYDKMADLDKSKKRAIDREQTLYQRSLHSGQEIIRFEIRLTKKRKLDEVLNNLGYKKNQTFRGIFSSDLSKEVVNSYWKKLIKDGSLGIFSPELSIKDMLRAIFLADKTIKPNHAIYLLGLFILSKADSGIRQLRNILSKRSEDRTWYRIAKDIQIASGLITQNRIRDWVVQIDKAMEEYRPYKVKVIPSLSRVASTIITR